MELVHAGSPSSSPGALWATLGWSPLDLWTNGRICTVRRIYNPSRIRELLTVHGWRCPRPERRAEAAIARGEWTLWPWTKTRYTTSHLSRRCSRLLVQGEVLESELAVAGEKEGEESKQAEQEDDHRAGIFSGPAPPDQSLGAGQSFGEGHWMNGFGHESYR
jgi:hypothetical protein